MDVIISKNVLLGNRWKLAAAILWQKQSPGPHHGAQLEPQLKHQPLRIFFAFYSFLIFILCPYPTAIIFSNGSLGTPRRPPRPVLSSTLEGRGSLEWSMSGCHYPSPPPPERDRRYQHKVSLVVRYFMIPCNICLILLATSTLGFAVLLFLNNCTLVRMKLPTLLLYCTVFLSSAFLWHLNVCLVVECVP